MMKSIAARFAAWRQHNATVRELSMLTDRELADLGIGRGDIPFVADGSLRDADEATVAVAMTALPSTRHAPTSMAA